MRERESERERERGMLCRKEMCNVFENIRFQLCESLGTTILVPEIFFFLESKNRL